MLDRLKAGRALRDAYRILQREARGEEIRWSKLLVWLRRIERAATVIVQALDCPSPSWEMQDSPFAPPPAPASEDRLSHVFNPTVWARVDAVGQLVAKEAPYGFLPLTRLQQLPTDPETRATWQAWWAYIGYWLGHVCRQSCEYLVWWWKLHLSSVAGLLEAMSDLLPSHLALIREDLPAWQYEHSDAYLERYPRLVYKSVELLLGASRRARERAVRVAGARYRARCFPSADTCPEAPASDWAGWALLLELHPRALAWVLGEGGPIARS